MGNIFAFISAFIVGVSYVFFKKSKKTEGQKYFAQALFSFIVFIAYLLLQPNDFGLSLTLVGIAILSAILAEALPLFALQQGNLAINTAVFSTYPIFTLLFSFVINNERIRAEQLVLVAITILAISYLSVIDEYLEKKTISVNFSVVIAILAAASAGLSDSISKYFINDSSTESFLFALAIMQIPIALAMISLQEKRPVNLKIDLKLDTNIILGGIMMGTGLVLFWYALSLSVTGIASSITSISVVFTIILAHIVLKEKIKLLHLPGIVFAFAGAFLLNYV